MASYQSQIDEENPHIPKDSLLSSISETSIRLGFIRKVYGILLLQLLLTMLITVFMMYNTTLVSFIYTNSWIFWVDIALVFIIMILLICVSKIARKVPINYILLCVFTLCIALMVGCIAAMTDPDIVFMAVIMTFCVTLSLTIYAFYTKTDFTYMGGFLFIFGMVVMVFAIFMCWGSNSTLSTILCAVIVILYGIYLVYDTQLIMGKHRFKFNIDDYVFAAMVIYIDIIGMFVELMRLMR